MSGNDFSSLLHIRSMPLNSDTVKYDLTSLDLSGRAQIENIASFLYSSDISKWIEEKWKTISLKPGWNIQFKMTPEQARRKDRVISDMMDFVCTEYIATKYKGKVGEAKDKTEEQKSLLSRAGITNLLKGAAPTKKRNEFLDSFMDQIASRIETVTE